MGDIKGIKTTINFSGDLKMSSYWKQWTAQDVFTCERYTKSGLVLLIDPEGSQVSVSKRHCNSLLAKK
jgi:hypothetical protein